MIHGAHLLKTAEDGQLIFSKDVPDTDAHRHETNHVASGESGIEGGLQTEKLVPNVVEISLVGLGQGSKGTGSSLGAVERDLVNVAGADTGVAKLFGHFAGIDIIRRLAGPETQAGNLVLRQIALEARVVECLVIGQPVIEAAAFGRLAERTEGLLGDGQGVFFGTSGLGDLVLSLIEVRGFDLHSKEGLRLDEGTTGLLKCAVVDLVGKKSRAFGRAEDRADVGDGARNLTLLG
jgi:hypothetical protein